MSPAERTDPCQKTTPLSAKNLLQESFAVVWTEGIYVSVFFGLTLSCLLNDKMYSKCEFNSKNQCTVCRNCRCLYVQVWNLWNKRSRKTIPKKVQYDSEIYYVLSFVFCKWRLKILLSSVFITSGYWEYFSDAEKGAVFILCESCSLCWDLHFCAIYPVLWRKKYGNKIWRKKTNVMVNLYSTQSFSSNFKR